jgi:ABC-type antimicrobial peptide transport system permease subunit
MKGTTMFTKAKNAVQLVIALAVITQVIRAWGSMGRDAVHAVEDWYYDKK